MQQIMGPELFPRAALGYSAVFGRH
jgi:hypothetical protein